MELERLIAILQEDAAEERWNNENVNIFAGEYYRGRWEAKEQIVLWIQSMMRKGF